MQERIRTLLLSGGIDLEHDWRRSSPFIRDLLERSRRFQVDVTEDPSSTLEAVGATQNYQLFIMNHIGGYVGHRWSEKACANFEEAIYGGKGLALIHAASVMFMDAQWMGYEKMAGLVWREGSGHARIHEFKVHIFDHEHPITQGLSNFNIWDELYHRLLNLHDVPIHVLAKAYSSPDKEGTGNEEPQIFVLQYGKGHVFNTLLGHVFVPQDLSNIDIGNTMIAYETEGFQKTLARGCEWAATGKVTLI